MRRRAAGPQVLVVEAGAQGARVSSRGQVLEVIVDVAKELGRLCVVRVEEGAFADSRAGLVEREEVFLVLGELAHLWLGEPLVRVDGLPDCPEAVDLAVVWRLVHGLFLSRRMSAERGETEQRTSDGTRRPDQKQPEKGLTCAQVHQ